MMRHWFFILLITWNSVVFSEPRIRPKSWATPIIEANMDNLYWVDKGIYRSEQPDTDSLLKLSQLGIKEILNLREYHSDEEAKKQAFKIHRIKMATGSVTEAQLLEALKIIKNRQSPILIHCWHGADRTGVTIAAYRIVMQNWTKPQAIDEMVNGNYGYHGTFYANLVELLENLNVIKMKQALKLDTLNREFLILKK